MTSGQFDDFDAAENPRHTEVVLLGRMTLLRGVLMAPQKDAWTERVDYQLDFGHASSSPAQSLPVCSVTKRESCGLLQPGQRLGRV